MCETVYLSIYIAGEGVGWTSLVTLTRFGPWDAKGW